MIYLLDTCAFLWLASKPEKLSRKAKAICNDSANEVWLSDVSVWEIVLKHGAEKLDLPETPRIWVSVQRGLLGLAKLELHESALYLSGELPDVHRDPFDRLLAAQAIERGMTLLSPDEPLGALGADREW